jgi:hypothetical protein
VCLLLCVVTDLTEKSLGSNVMAVMVDPADAMVRKGGCKSEHYWSTTKEEWLLIINGYELSDLVSDHRRA